MSVLKSKRSTSKAEYVNPQGCFTKTDGRSIPAAEATKKLDDMAQNLGEKIDRENELIKAVLESDRKRK